MSKALDDILNDALEEYEEEEELGATRNSNNNQQRGGGGAGRSNVAAAASRAVAAAASVGAGGGQRNTTTGGGGGPTTSDDVMRESIQRMMKDMGDQDFQHALEATLQEMGGPGAAGGGGSEDGAMAADIFRSLAVESGAKGAEGVAKTLEILQKLTVEADNMGAGGIPGAGMSSDSADAAEGLSDEVIARMMKEFEAMGQKEDFAGVVDNMMRQLLSKDIMYVPMKSICERFPDWLAAHAHEQTKEQYENYGKMYQSFQKLVMVYETEPENFPRLMELMQDLQECGQPPSEIIKDLAPGLELSPDGLPMMPNMGPGGLPQGGGPGLPAAGCSIQ